MSGSGKNTDNKNKRKQFKRNERENTHTHFHVNGKLEKKKGSLYDRPKWVPPVQSAAPMQSETCAWCNKPIKDVAAAFNEPDTDKLLHFDCVLKRITEKEHLEKGETINYIGGGRFGIVRFSSLSDNRNFKIKKIFEYEDKENRAKWRDALCNHYSVT